MGYYARKIDATCLLVLLQQIESNFKSQLGYFASVDGVDPNMIFLIQDNSQDAITSNKCSAKIIQLRCADKTASFFLNFSRGENYLE
jgi:hypothetical protein